MALQTVAQLRDSVSGILQGTDLNKVTNLYTAFERAARNLLQQADVPEASGRQNYMLYDGVFDYPAPSTIFGGAFNDLRPQGVSRTTLDEVYKQPIKLFDQTKCLSSLGYQVTFEYRNGSGIMRVANSRADQSVTLDGMNATTGWSVGGSASGLALDETVYYAAPAALRFTLTGSSTGFIEKNLSVPLSLSTYDNVGVAFLAIRTPSVSNVTSIELRVGSSSANYNSVTATTGFLGAFTTDNYLLVPFDFSGASETGTPDWSAIDYVRVIVNHTGTITNFRVGALFMALPSPHELLFQSSAIFIHQDGTVATTIETDSDQIMLNPAAFLIYEHECAKEIAFQNGGTLASNVVQTIQAKLHGSGNDVGLYAHYRADNPSEEIRVVGNWY